MFIMGLLLGGQATAVSATTSKLLQMVATFVMFGVPAIVFMRLSYSQRRGYHLGFRPPSLASYYGLGIAVLVVAFPFEVWLGILNRHIPLPDWAIKAEELAEQQTRTLLAAKSGLDVAFNLLVIAIIPGIFEEMFFRGVVQRLLIGITKRPWLGICITAAIFSFMHFELQGFLPRFFLGILLGAMFWYSGSLWTCILGHAVFNGIQVVIASYSPQTVDDKNPSVPIYSVFVSLVLVLILLGIMRRRFQQTGSTNVNTV
jgi:membrane protease YdiL (CAAX protease family)